jgi:hypothetical protein
MPNIRGINTPNGQHGQRAAEKLCHRPVHAGLQQQPIQSPGARYVQLLSSAGLRL